MFADIDHKHTDVQKELLNWGEWFVNFIEIDGMRFDALKHIDISFIEQFIKHIEKNVERDFYFFGEYWVYEESKKSNYLYETKYHTDLFDVAFHYNMVDRKSTRLNSSHVSNSYAFFFLKKKRFI